MEYSGLYGFQNLTKVKFPGFENKTTQELLVKWSMICGIKLQAYSFSCPFKEYLHDEFIQDFLSCPAVISTLERATHDLTFRPIGIPAETIKFSRIKCSQTNLELFDKLLENKDIVRKGGAIVKCIPEYFNPLSSDYEGPIEEIEIADNLRKLIIMEDECDEEIKDIFSLDERDEFLFRLFGHLVIGGALCQYEDNITPYIDTTKLLYKDLVSVASSPEKGLHITSLIYKIHSASSDSLETHKWKDLLFEKPQFNNFFYIFINPIKQICYTLYHHV